MTNLVTTSTHRTRRHDLTRQDIAALAAEEGVSEVALVTSLQVGAAASGDEAALEALCAIKAEILGL